VGIRPPSWVTWVQDAGSIPADWQKDCEHIFIRMRSTLCGGAPESGWPRLVYIPRAPSYELPDEFDNDHVIIEYDECFDIQMAFGDRRNDVLWVQDAGSILADW